MPPRVGPNRNIYQFTKLRDDYKLKFIQTTQRMQMVENALNGVHPSQPETPKFDGVYGSLVMNDLALLDYCKQTTRGTKRGTSDGKKKSTAVMAETYGFDQLSGVMETGRTT